MRRTKIVCTIGPASDDSSILKGLIAAGLNVARLNFSHGTHEEHLARVVAIRKLAAEMGVLVPIMLDTKGPEIRSGVMADGPIELRPGARFVLTTHSITGNADMVSVTYPALPQELVSGDRIFIDDGLLELIVEDTTSTDVVCRVISGGTLGSRKGINLPGKRIPLPTISAQDEEDLKFAVEHGIDFIAASFTRSAGDIREIKGFLASKGASIPVIAKIENREGLDNLDTILHEADGLMVARGDMGIELPAEEIPIIQKAIINRCRAAGKPVITATQMLDSMTRNPKPTRAEVNDVANAVFDGTDAVMLSGETATGRYPVQSVETMSRIASRTEQALPDIHSWPAEAGSQSVTVTNAIGHATVQVAASLKAAAIITSTQSGWTARMVARHRPDVPIVAVTPDENTAKHLCLLWGVYPLVGKAIASTDEMVLNAEARAVEAGLVSAGDIVVITAGVPVGVSGTTNLLKVHVVGS